MDSELPEQNEASRAFPGGVHPVSRGLEGPRAAANPLTKMPANAGNDAPQRVLSKSSTCSVDASRSVGGAGKMVDPPQPSPRSVTSDPTHHAQKRKQKIAMMVDWHDSHPGEKEGDDEDDGFYSRAMSKGFVRTITDGVLNTVATLRGDKRVKSFMEVMQDIQLEESKANIKKARKTWTSSLLMSRYFNGVMTFLIVLNAAYIGIETDFGGEDIVWFVIECCFTVCFSFELGLRMYVHKSYFWYPLQGWNLFDFILVTTAVVDLLVSFAVMAGARDDDSGIMSIFLSLRTLKIARIIRPLRLLRFFKELWLLFSGVLSSIRTLCWTWILILLTIYVFGIFTTRALGLAFGCQQVDGVSPNASLVNVSLAGVQIAECSAEGALMNEKFGSVSRSMYTLFQLITTEGWADVARASMVLEPMIWIFFVLFMSLTTFAIMNVVTAVIVENTLLQALDLRQDVMKKLEDEKTQAMNKIFDVFEIADTDGDRTLNKEEFLIALEKPEVKLLLHDVEIDLRNAGILFDILDYDQSGTLDAAEFLDGCMRARGEARAKDVLALQCDLYRTQRYLKDAVERLSDSVEDRFEKLLEDAQWLAQLVAPDDESRSQTLEDMVVDARVADIGNAGSLLRFAEPASTEQGSLRHSAHAAQ